MSSANDEKPSKGRVAEKPALVTALEELLHKRGTTTRVGLFYTSVDTLSLSHSLVGTMVVYHRLVGDSKITSGRIEITPITLC